MPLGLEQITRAVCNRSRRGLYAGKKVIFGNRVSEDGGNRTRRKWKPNVHTQSLYSEALDRMLRLRVTPHALRCIDKAGGLDSYLLNTPDKKLQSDVGMALRAQVAAALEQQKVVAQQGQAQRLEVQQAGQTL
ncbi:hypothetical protein WJX72_008080 [[Myrmecia] bisecta]|uniref:Large ribosomal subunit protein bL28m n=1 Tax=[Myrmecia] bisecta TaxID=41462 RepID=A0AAW1QAT1_9CHLO